MAEPAQDQADPREAGPLDARPLDAGPPDGGPLDGDPLDAGATRRLLRPLDGRRDHVRGGRLRGALRRGRATLVIYGDYLCPYCRQLGPVLAHLREALGERASEAFRHFPNERIHPGAEFLACAAEAAGRQGRFWEMHDAIYGQEPPIDRAATLELAERLGFDMERFHHDVDDPKVYRRVHEDRVEGVRNGVTATPTLFIDNVRYDGAWDFHSLLEALVRPVGAQVQRTARAFANLPTSAGLVLLLAAALAVAFANSSLAGAYQHLITARLGVEVAGRALTLSLTEWCSDGLLTIFFLIVGLEIRRELTVGSLSEPRAAAAPLLAALGGVIVPAAAYLSLNPGPTAAGWVTPVDTGLAFTLGVMAVFGRRASAGLKAFVAAYAVAEDICVLVILAVFFPHNLHPGWLAAAAAAVAGLATLNRWRVYAVWPYVALALALWLSLRLGGVDAAIAGVLLAACLPARPAPAAAPLLAQAATALAELEEAEREAARRGEKRRIEQEPIWDWASRNLSAAAARLLSPAEAIERSVEPWSTYVVLPLFAFTAAGVSLAVDLDDMGARRVLWGVVLGLALGKPLGIVVAAWAAAKARIARLPAGVTPLAFLGAAWLCGIGDPLSILLADQAFGAGGLAGVAKLGVFAGSLAAAALGTIALLASGAPISDGTPAAAAGSAA